MNRLASLAGVSVLGFTLACGGGDGSDVATTPTTPTTTEPSSPAGGLGDLLTAGVHFGLEICSQKDGDNCANAAATFPHDVPTLYSVLQTKDLPRLGQTYTIQWVAVDVGEAAPAGTVIAAVDATVSDAAMLAVSTHYTVSSEISTPTAGWPVGSYKVAVLLDGAPVTETAYAIQ